MRCHVCKLECDKPKRCSKCQKTVYCSTECQRQDWKVHKRSTCTKPAVLHKVDKLMKPGSLMDRLSRWEDAAWEERKRNPEPASSCDGCTLRFRGYPPEEGLEDVADVGDPAKKCDECQYTICETCTHYSGIPYFDRPHDTCRCPKSNFGVSYCLSSPCYKDGDGKKRYYGDRHPPIAESGYGEGAFEAQARRCRTCGVVARCLKKEHLKDAMPGIV